MSSNNQKQSVFSSIIVMKKVIPSLLLLVLFFLCAINNNNNIFVNAHEISKTFPYSEGTVEPSLKALNGFNLKTVANPSSATSNFHLRMFSRSDETQFSSFPVMAAPACVASNISTTQPIEFTLELLGLWMQNNATYTSVDVQSPRATGTVSLDDLKMVLARTSSTNSILAHAMHVEGVPGWIHVHDIPQSVLTNTSIIFVDTDDDVAQYLRTNADTIGFLPVARGDAIPCAAIRITNVFSKEKVLTYPRLDEESIADLVVEIDHAGIFSSNAGYPLIGALIIEIPKSLQCISSSADSAVNFLTRLFTESAFSAPLLPWGMILLSAADQLAVLRELYSVLPCITLPRVVGRGSSAVEPVAAQWILDYLHDNRIFIDYTPTGSGSGLRAITSNNARFAISDAIFTDSERSEFPEVKFFPAVAFGISIIFNVPGIDRLTIPRCLVPRIFDGTVTKFNDPRIQAVNPAFSLPNIQINIVVRSTRSGTTESFTSALRNLDLACNPGKLSSPINVTSVWELPSQINTSSTGALLNALRSNSYSIGYASTPTVRIYKIDEVTLQDEATGVLASPSTDQVSSALSTPASSSVSLLDHRTGEVNLSSIASDPSIYPFVGVSYFVVRNALPAGNCTELSTALTFVRHAVEDATPRQATIGADYIPVSTEFTEFAVSVLSSMVCAGQYIFPPEAVAEVVDPMPIIVGSVVPAFVLIFVGVVLLQYWINRRVIRSTEHAVKSCGKNENFAIVTVDLENTTYLWSYCPHAMPECIDMFQRILADTVAKYKGYEVKEVNDTYLFVFKDLINAFQFAASLHTTLQNTKWPYLELNEAMIEWSNDPSCPFSFSSDLKSNRANPDIFNGLTVRISMELGDSSISIKKDPKSEQYVYFGHNVNVSAKCCQLAHGGQTLVTKTFFNTIVSDDNNRVIVNSFNKMTDLGRQRLRNLSEPVHVHQLMPMELTTRKFPPLRLSSDEEDIEEELLYGNGFDFNTSSSLPYQLGGSGKLPSTNNSSMSSLNTMQSDASSVMSASGLTADQVYQLRLQFAELLARSHRISQRLGAPQQIIVLADQLKMMFSTSRSGAKRNAMVNDLVRNWRLAQVSDSRIHLKTRSILGNESYWLMRLAAKLVAVCKSPGSSTGKGSSSNGSNSSGNNNNTTTTIPTDNNGGSTRSMQTNGSDGSTFGGSGGGGGTLTNDTDDENGRPYSRQSDRDDEDDNNNRSNINNVSNRSAMEKTNTTRSPNNNSSIRIDDTHHRQVPTGADRKITKIQTGGAELFIGNHKVSNSSRPVLTQNALYANSLSSKVDDGSNKQSSMRGNNNTSHNINTSNNNINMSNRRNNNNNNNINNINNEGSGAYNHILSANLVFDASTGNPAITMPLDGSRPGSVAPEPFDQDEVDAIQDTRSEQDWPTGEDNNNTNLEASSDCISMNACNNVMSSLRRSDIHNSESDAHINTKYNPSININKNNSKVAPPPPPPQPPHFVHQNSTNGTGENEILLSSATRVTYQQQQQQQQEDNNNDNNNNVLSNNIVNQPPSAMMVFNDSRENSNSATDLMPSNYNNKDDDDGGNNNNNNSMNDGQRQQQHQMIDYCSSSGVGTGGGSRRIAFDGSLPQLAGSSDSLMTQETVMKIPFQDPYRRAEQK